MEHKPVLPKLNLRETIRGNNIFIGEIEKRIKRQEEILASCFNRADSATLEELSGLLTSQRNSLEELIKAKDGLSFFIKKYVETH